MAEERFIDVARRVVEGEASAPARAYRRLRNAAAAIVALEELGLRLMLDETPEQTERRMAA